MSDWKERVEAVLANWQKERENYACNLGRRGIWMRCIDDLTVALKEEELDKLGQTRRYVKKPIVVDAYQTIERREIHTLEGTMVAEPGDWIVTGIKGESYPVKPDIFVATYEPHDVRVADIRQMPTGLEA